MTSIRPDEYRSPFLPENGSDFNAYIEADLPPKSPELVDRLTRTALELAESITALNPENIDPKRVEFGSTVVALTEEKDRRDLSHAEIKLSDSLTAFGARVIAYRNLEQQESDTTPRNKQDYGLAA